MKKAEAFRAPNSAQISLGVKYSPSAHGTSGNVVSGFPNPYPCPECKIWDTLIDSGTGVFPGLRTAGDIDQCSGDPRGAARCSYSIIPGSGDSGNNSISPNVRSSSAQSYLYSLPPAARPNLHILVEHRAVRIVWDTTGSGNAPKPQGVEILTQDTSSSPSFLVKVAKEIIVSSGSLGVSRDAFHAPPQRLITFAIRIYSDTQVP
jgi:choline dehydrogenase